MVYKMFYKIVTPKCGKNFDYDIYTKCGKSFQSDCSIRFIRIEISRTLYVYES